MKRRGFTLIEMIAVVLIMALLTLIILPTITNQIRSQKENISDASLKLIYEATNLYLSEKQEEFPLKAGATYCTSLETLVNEGKLQRPLKDMTTGKEIPLNKVVKTVVNEYNDGEPELVEADACTVVLPNI